MEPVTFVLSEQIETITLEPDFRKKFLSEKSSDETEVYRERPRHSDIKEAYSAGNVDVKYCESERNSEMGQIKSLSTTFKPQKLSTKISEPRM